MKKKKTVIYAAFIAICVYFFVQVSYFNEAYSPLQVLSDARSEAKRLLRFITLQHFQCNSTIQISNNTYWPICIEKEGGINIDSRGKKIAYSVGPKGDLEFERIIAKNLSFNLYLFGTGLTTSDFSVNSNNTRNMHISVVPNDPADFVRNSYDTQTVNNVMLSLGHTYIDILKMDHFMDSSHSHDVLYFMIKDDLLSRVGQLHIALHIDKVDDDYLYSWYRALYNLFHDAGFRLYHTAANDQLCLQVTLMESCVYYMSWVRDPGPRASILYPPAQDGSEESEVERLVDYLEDEEATCSDSLDIGLSNSLPLGICLNEGYLHKPCNIIIVRNKHTSVTVSSLSKGQCHAVVLETQSSSYNYNIHEFFVNVKGSLLPVMKHHTTLIDALDQHLHTGSSNILYLDMPELFWDMIGPLLDSGHMQSVNQLIVDVDVWNELSVKPSHNIRRRFSELKRIGAYGFQIYRSKTLLDTHTLHFQSNLKTNRKCCHRINFVRTKHVSIT
ncbi:uncharacterized protein LOC117324193 [Pecten maximus]|uniref:uncharacterized protein LOC117324193 n=2 Tax=Pecten maximus TaxID=6579 RepID=UPI001458660D|nr:uncharacterized protein LOC117324193 [Pecten maximus]